MSTHYSKFETLATKEQRKLFKEINKLVVTGETNKLGNKLDVNSQLDVRDERSSDAPLCAAVARAGRTCPLRSCRLLYELVEANRGVWGERRGSQHKSAAFSALAA